MLDYEQSIIKLINRVKLIHEANWSPTPEAKALDALAQKLNETIAMMDESTYWGLEDAFNQPERGWVRFDGTKEPDIDRSGRYAAVRWAMHELAEFAMAKKSELPNSREKRALPFAAMGLLHIMYQSGSDRPSLYINGDAIKKLGDICNDAGIALSPESLKGALKNALDSFDPLYQNDGIVDILVFSQ